MHSAIIVTGDYRLLPKSTGADIYEDVSDFWDWIRTDLQPFLSSTRPGVEADLDKVLVHGESAGGTISMVSAFSQARGFIKAVIPMYPAITLVPKRSKPNLGSPPIPESILREHLNSMQHGNIVAEATPPERINIMLSVAQIETIHKYYGTAEKHDIWKLLEKADDMPYTLILHGQEDSGVPVEDNVEWVAAARKKFGEGKIMLHVEPGAEHGFDTAVPLETAWLQEALKPMTAHWLGLQD
jgi:acetyl esterase/lipase